MSGKAAPSVPGRPDRECPLAAPAGRRDRSPGGGPPERLRAPPRQPLLLQSRNLTCIHVHDNFGGMTEAHSLGTAITADDAQRIARLMAGLGTASRVRILGRLRAGPCSVGELTDAVAM